MFLPLPLQQLLLPLNIDVFLAVFLQQWVAERRGQKGRLLTDEFSHGLGLLVPVVEYSTLLWICLQPTTHQTSSKLTSPQPNTAGKTLFIDTQDKGHFYTVIDPLDTKGNYSTTSNNTKLVHWPLMGGLLHLVQREMDWVGPQPAQAPPRCTKCNSPHINGQCTNDVLLYNSTLLCSFNVGIKGLINGRKYRQ